MNSIEFIFALHEGGYTQEQCQKIDNILIECARRYPYSLDELQSAAHQYLICCRDVDKLIGFIKLSDEMCRGYCASWEQAHGFVLNVVVGWCG